MASWHEDRQASSQDQAGRMMDELEQRLRTACGQHAAYIDVDEQVALVVQTLNDRGILDRRWAAGRV